MKTNQEDRDRRKRIAEDLIHAATCVHQWKAGDKEWTLAAILRRGASDGIQRMIAKRLAEEYFRGWLDSERTQPNRVEANDAKADHLASLATDSFRVAAKGLVQEILEATKPIKRRVKY